MSTDISKPSDGGELGGSPAAQKPVSKFTRWYRSPLFNVIVVGLISFT